MNTINCEDIKMVMVLFDNGEYRNFYSTKSWYTPIGNLNEKCEAEFNEKEAFNKNILLEYGNSMTEMK